MKPVTLSGPDGIDDLTNIYPYAFMREHFTGPLMAAGDLTPALAQRVLDKKGADVFVFGRSYISNPDLPERIRAGAALAVPNQATFYGGGAEGLIDYPAMA